MSKLGEYVNLPGYGVIFRQEDGSWWSPKTGETFPPDSDVARQSEEALAKKKKKEDKK